MSHTILRLGALACALMLQTHAAAVARGPVLPPRPFVPQPPIMHPPNQFPPPGATAPFLRAPMAVPTVPRFNPMFVAPVVGTPAVRQLPINHPPTGLPFPGFGAAVQRANPVFAAQMARGPFFIASNTNSLNVLARNNALTQAAFQAAQFGQATGTLASPPLNPFRTPLLTSPIASALSNLQAPLTPAVTPLNPADRLALNASLTQSAFQAAQFGQSIGALSFPLTSPFASTTPLGLMAQVHVPGRVRDRKSVV